MDLQKWLHESTEFYWAILHEDQGAKDVVEVCSTADKTVFFKKWKILPLAEWIVKMETLIRLGSTEIV
jgi:hypothetical protein